MERLEQVFKELDRRVVSKKCEALEGLIREAEEVTAGIDDEATLDAAIISSAQTVDHYEIARYGSLSAWADQLRLTEAVGLLEATLAEERAADQKLSGLAEDAVNQLQAT